MQEQLSKINSWINLHSEKEDVGEEAGLDWNKIEISEKDVCTIIYTSGTSDVPKAVMLTHKNIMTVVNSMEKNLTTGRKILLLIPMNHCFGCILGVLGTLRWGKTLCISKSPINILYEIQYYEADTLMMVPALIHYLYNIMNKYVRAESKIRDSNKIKIKYIISGGAPLAVDYINKFNEWGIEIYVGYGMTESSSLISVNNSTYNKIGTVGKTASCCDVMINKKANEQFGEILIKGDNVAHGYYKNPDATQKSIQGKWFKTGDIGYIDEEGYLYITGRIKNIYVLDNGQKVSLEELESFLERIEFIKESQVTAIRAKNGKIVFKAMVWLGYDSNTPEEQEKVARSIKELNLKLPDYKKIREIQFLNSPLPRTASGKIKR